MDRNDGSSARGRDNDNHTSRDDVWNWAGDDLASERVTDAVRRWLKGMESAIGTANSERKI